ncbi:murein transglycosylase [Neisseria elongata subsp. glycolytica ATCC 29315]|uniref:LysM domain protein n=1 Tax=Neisseria elongata subsp. glycolytica ATCC 29315 TaxID=546263 RepID=D4DUA1_NEIEG|nr:LysM peptidoglycan-binding domain-containing protein [Neisseria elongata]AJE18327.1 murein transglycosylase [Neisseria elongata subsp. glycolytica ATCC 29315]EFE48685.1 LysM domain protein [Neisseria elongata subsp. glycolytica ATCC 29315]SQH50188.1 membrane bound murein transglycosylase [Neisseria elongata subsp. glycolytica]
MTHIKTLVAAITGLSFFSAPAFGQTYTKNQIGMTMMRTNTIALDHGKIKSGHNSIWAHLRGDFRMSEVNPELVRHHESKFVSSSAYFKRTIERSRPYMYHISNEVAKRNMPAEIALLPFIESAYVTKAKSHVGASGLWQFMPATGRHYGLEQTPLYDGRHDIYAATDAALNYLQYLHGLFGDWSLALAAYNWGEGNVGRAVNRARAQGLEPVYENLRMPNETRNYVPKLLAVRNIVNNPEYFGMSFADLDNKPFFKAVDIDQPIDLSAAVRLADISQAEFDALNPAFKSPVYIPKTGRKLLLPATAIATFERNYKKADRASLLSWDVYTPYADTTLSSIAAETGMSTAELKRLNGLSKESVAAGRSLLIAKNRFSGSPAAVPANFATLDADINPNDNKLQTVPNLNIAVTETTFKPNRQTVDIQTASAAQPAPDTLRPPVQTAAVDFTKQTAQAAAPTVTNQPVAAAPAAPSTDEVEDRIRQLASASASQNAPQPATAAVADGGNNELLMTFVQESGLSENSDTVTVADSSPNQLENEQAAQEAAERSRQAKLAAERVKQQKQAAEARALAAAKNSGTPTTHKVGSGDTLFNIAKRYDMNVADLIASNNIKGNTIHTGQILKVAAAKGKQTAKASVQPVSYTVRQGDTLTDIARRFNVNVNDVRRWNNNSSNIKPGQNIKLQGS